MKDIIEQVLSDEAYATNEERVDAIAKGLATVVIPKDKYNDLSSRLKNTETNLTNVQFEYDEFKKSKMTEDERQAARLQELENEKKANAITRSELGVQKLLLKNGIEINEDDTELTETLQNIISEDYDKSIKLANNFITLLNKTKETTANETTTKLLNETPRPIGGTDSSATVSNVDLLRKELDEAIKNKDVVKQTQIMTRIYQEQQKM